MGRATASAAQRRPGVPGRDLRKVPHRHPRISVGGAGKSGGGGRTGRHPGEGLGGQGPRAPMSGDVFGLYRVCVCAYMRYCHLADRARDASKHIKMHMAASYNNELFGPKCP